MEFEYRGFRLSVVRKESINKWEARLFKEETGGWIYFAQAETQQQACRLARQRIDEKADKQEAVDRFLYGRPATSAGGP